MNFEHKEDIVIVGDRFIFPSEIFFESGSDIAIKETNKINQIEILCLSCPGVVGSQGGCVNNQGVLVTTDIDFISFTENEPYQP